MAAFGLLQAAFGLRLAQKNDNTLEQTLGFLALLSGVLDVVTWFFGW